MSESSSPASGGSAAGGRPPQPTPLPAGGPRHARNTPAGDTAQFPVQRPNNPSGEAGQWPQLLQQRLHGTFLTIIGLAGIASGVLFSIEAPRFTPVPVVFLTFWLVMVIVGRILFTGLSKLREAGVRAPAPQQVRAAAAVAGIVVAVGMMGFATTTGSGTAAAAPCPGGGPATCGPTGPELTFTPPPAQTGAQGEQQGGQQGGQDQQGIATSPAKGGDNGPGIQAQTPEFGTPGQQAPNIPGNEQPGQNGQGGQQQPAQGQQTGQQNPVRTTAPGRPDQTGQQQTGQPTQSGQPSQSTVTVTQTQSQCPAPAPGGGNGGPGAPGTEGGNGPDNGGEHKDGPPSWAYLVAEATGVMSGRRRTTGTSNGATALRDGQIASEQTSRLLNTSPHDQAPGDELRTVYKTADNKLTPYGDDAVRRTSTDDEVDRANEENPLRDVFPRRPLTPKEKEAKRRVRGKSPTDGARDRVQGDPNYGAGKSDPAFPGQTQTGKPDADHIIPVDLLPQIPGFPYLPPDDMVRIAELLDEELSNMVPASPSENRSRQNKLWQEYLRHSRLGEVDEALKALREMQTLELLPKIRQQIIDTLLDPKNLENLKEFLRSMGYTEEQIREFMNMSAEQQRDAITRLVNGLPPKPLELDPIPSDPAEVAPKPGSSAGVGGATVPPIPSVTPDGGGPGAGGGSDSGAGVGSGSGTVSGSVGSGSVGSGVGGSASAGLPSQADMPQKPRPANPNIDLSGLPLGAMPTIHARDMLPDGWEPPNSGERDLAWARYNGAQAPGVADNATIMEAWNAWLIADQAYQQAVQEHWQAQGWAGSAPPLTAICFVSRVDPSSALSPVAQMAQAAQQAAEMGAADASAAAALGGGLNL